MRLASGEASETGRTMAEAIGSAVEALASRPGLHVGLIAVPCAFSSTACDEDIDEFMKNLTTSATAHCSISIPMAQWFTTTCKCLDDGHVPEFVKQTLVHGCVPNASTIVVPMNIVSCSSVG